MHTSLNFLSSIIAGLLLLEEGLAVSARSPAVFLTSIAYGPHFLSPLLWLPSAWPPVLETPPAQAPMLSCLQWLPPLLPCIIAADVCDPLVDNCAAHVLESSGGHSHIICLEEVDEIFGVTWWNRTIWASSCSYSLPSSLILLPFSLLIRIHCHNLFIYFLKI